MKIKLPFLREFEWTHDDTFAMCTYLVGVVVGTFVERYR